MGQLFPNLWENVLVVKDFQTVCQAEAAGVALLMQAGCHNSVWSGHGAVCFCSRWL